MVLDGSGGAHTAVAGEELELTGEGVDSSVLQGTAWAWVLQTAPARSLHQETLEAILEWTVRETGWRIEGLDDPQVRSKLVDTFSGDMKIAPDQLLPLVLPTFGLTGHLDADGTLRIEP